MLLTKSQFTKNKTMEDVMKKLVRDINLYRERNMRRVRNKCRNILQDMKKRIEELEEKEVLLLESVNKFPLYLTDSAYHHNTTCPRSPLFEEDKFTARGGRLCYSVIFNLKGTTPIDLFPGSHLGKAELNGMQRINRYHDIVLQKVVLQERVIFDMNLVHAGGENETSNPLAFATFSEGYMAFEN